MTNWTKINKGLPTTEAAFKLLEEGEERKAFTIFRKFKLGLTKMDISALELYSEILNGHSSMYIKMGVDITKAKEEAYKVLKKIVIPERKADPTAIRTMKRKRPQ